MEARPSPHETRPYRAERLIGLGARSRLWYAEGPEEPVALKVARAPGDRGALQREAELLRACRHPHLVQLLAADTEGAWLALEWVEGTPLHLWAPGRSFRELHRVMTELLGGILHLHQQRLVHSDIKPTNVIVDREGHPKLVDLSSARREDDRRRAPSGTPGFAAPEVMRGDPPSRASDMFGFGALLYTALTGRGPFHAANPAAALHMPLITLPLPPSAFRARVPASIDRLVLSLLSREPRLRPDGPSVVDALDAAFEDRPSPPLVGMLTERDALRRHLLEVEKGATRVVVLYGPPGCGRQTLIDETLAVAVGQGIYTSSEADPEALADQLAEDPRPTVVQFSANTRGLVRGLRRLIGSHAPVLVLVRGRRPLAALADLGAVHLTPSPLDPDNIRQLQDYYRLPGDRSQEWWRASQGLPRAVRALVKRDAAVRRDRSPRIRLTGAASRILETVRQHGEIPLEKLSEDLGWSSYEILDQCEPLFAHGLIVPAAEGKSIRAVADGDAR